MTAFFFLWVSVERKAAVVANKDMNVSLVHVGEVSIYLLLGQSNVKRRMCIIKAPQRAKVDMGSQLIFQVLLKSYRFPFHKSN